MPSTIAVPDALFRDVIAVRRDIHRHPELGFNEVRTAGIVAARLRELGFDEVHEGIATTGVIGILRGKKPGRTIMLRADMDALPMPEENTHEFRSSIDGVMHACGHDTHVAMLLGAAELVVKQRTNLAGTVVFCFQPAEEGGGGARVMVEEGMLERFGVERAYGIHSTSALPTGKLAFKSGPIMASTDNVFVEVIGHGGHGAAPQFSIDPILVASDFVVSVQRVVSRNIDPIHPAVVSVCSFHSGTTTNVIPTSAHLKGTIRAFDETVRNEIPHFIERTLKGCCEASGATYKLEIQRNFPVTVNDDAQTAYARSVAEAALGPDAAVDGRQVMGAEDFSYFAQKVPASFVFLGTRSDDASTHFPNHHGKFDVDESALELGTGLYAALALDAPQNAP